MEAQPLLLHLIAALLAHWLVIQLLLESQGKITQRAGLHERHLLLVSEPTAEQFCSFLKHIH